MLDGFNGTRDVLTARRLQAAQKNEDAGPGGADQELDEWRWVKVPGVDDEGTSDR